MWKDQASRYSAVKYPSETSKNIICIQENKDGNPDFHSSSFIYSDWTR